MWSNGTDRHKAEFQLGKLSTLVEIHINRSELVGSISLFPTVPLSYLGVVMLMHDEYQKFQKGSYNGKPV